MSAIAAGSYFQCPDMVGESMQNSPNCRLKTGCFCLRLKAKMSRTTVFGCVSLRRHQCNCDYDDVFSQCYTPSDGDIELFV
jgi:hypothetical protein